MTMTNHIGPIPASVPVHSGVAKVAGRFEMPLAAAVVFLSPFNVIRVPGVYLTASDICVLVALFVLIITGRLTLAPFGRFSTIWYGGFLALAGGLLIGSIANQRLVEGAEVLAQYFFAMVIVPMVITRRSIDECHTLIGIFALSMCVASLHGIYLIEFATNPPLNFVSISGRLRGVVERSNEAAALGAMALVAVLYLGAERQIRRTIVLPAAAVILYGIFLTASNTGLFAAGIGAAVYTALQRTRRHIGNMLLLVAMGVLVIAVFGTDILPASFMNRVAGALTSADLSQAGSFDGRMELVQEGWDKAADHLFIGIGADGYRYISRFDQPVHNTYVLMLVEGGALSLAGLVMMFAGTAMLGIARTLYRPTRNRGAFVLAMALICLLVLNAFAHVFARFWIVPVVLVIALAVSGSDYPHGRSTPARKD
ncbi:O-Antigen ligase [Rhodobacteraceae bacterium THAF1]|nr:O-Antigen ligase [Palleronia sp. THAF1]VDC31448.1 O-Antigen ligase [Rhodobacteraceae bacterium THAF1]